MSHYPLGTQSARIHLYTFAVNGIPVKLTNMSRYPVSLHYWIGGSLQGIYRGYFSAAVQSGLPFEMGSL